MADTQNTPRRMQINLLDRNGFPSGEIEADYLDMLPDGKIDELMQKYLDQGFTLFSKLPGFEYPLRSDGYGYAPIVTTYTPEDGGFSTMAGVTL